MRHAVKRRREDWSVLGETVTGYINEITPIVFLLTTLSLYQPVHNRRKKYKN